MSRSSADLSRGWHRANLTRNVCGHFRLTDTGHRLCSPAIEYAEAFRPAQQLLTMAAIGGQLLSITVSIDYNQALAALLKVHQQFQKFVRLINVEAIQQARCRGVLIRCKTLALRSHDGVHADHAQKLMARNAAAMTTKRSKPSQCMPVTRRQGSSGYGVGDIAAVDPIIGDVDSEASAASAAPAVPAPIMSVTEADVHAVAAWLLYQLVPFSGRHIAKVAGSHSTGMGSGCPRAALPSQPMLVHPLHCALSFCRCAYLSRYRLARSAASFHSLQQLRAQMLGWRCTPVRVQISICLQDITSQRSADLSRTRKLVVQ